jgi:hypothetical protein
MDIQIVDIFYRILVKVIENIQKQLNSDLMAGAG